MITSKQAGLPQCMAEMIAAQIFNERRNNNISEIYGWSQLGQTGSFYDLAIKLWKSI